MIFESEDERRAFNFICDVADDEFSRRGCNDLSPYVRGHFEHITIKRDDGRADNIRFDFDILHWLVKQIKEGEYGNKGSITKS